MLTIERNTLLKTAREWAEIQLPIEGHGTWLAIALGLLGAARLSQGATKNALGWGICRSWDRLLPVYKNRPDQRAYLG